MPVLSYKNEIEDVFTFPFSDAKSSTKLLIASLLMLANFVLPLVPVFVLNGYMLEIRRRVILDGKLEMPEWTNWGKYLIDGAKTVAISFLYGFPIYFLTFIVGMVIFLPGILLIGETFMERNPSPWIIAITGVICLGGIVGLGLIILASNLFCIILPAAICHFAVDGQFSSAFKISEWWAICRRNASDFVIAYIAMIVLSIITSLLIQVLGYTIILCVIVPIIYCAIMVYIMLVNAGLTAKAYLGGLQKSGSR